MRVVTLESDERAGSVVNHQSAGGRADCRWIIPVRPRGLQFRPIGPQFNRALMSMIYIHSTHIIRTPMYAGLLVDMVCRRGRIYIYISHMK